ncbi:copper resistance protein CopC, partial [Frankia sp. EI5c]|uniref:copper resistance protein CopC n=1 Tax=Frankia sp. EI5c TaxID=683316 RepID=UPI0018FE3D1F
MTGLERDPGPNTRPGWRAGGARRVLAVVAMTAFALLATALPAAAHATLTGSSPVGGAALETAPTRVTLSFSES